MLHPKNSTNYINQKYVKVYKKILDKSLLKFTNESNIDSYVECGICGYRTTDLAQHPQIHGISQTEYRSKYGHIKCKDLRDSMVGNKNPGYRHGGKLSPFSKNFVNYTNDLYIEELKQKCVKTKVDNNTNPLSTAYYTKDGYTEDESIELIRNRQTTFSLDICIEKYGVEEGTQRWSDRQAKWLKNFKRMNYSKISQELFNELAKTYIGDIYFATYQRDEVLDKSNKEYRLVLIDKTYIMPDFICLNTKRIIEFDGDYWHSENVANPTKEKDRDRRIIESGYTVLHIKECNYKIDKQKSIQECINFLTQ